VETEFKESPMPKVEVKLKGVHGSLKKSIEKLSKVNDPVAAKLRAAMIDFNAKSKCGQTNVFKFEA
jgi:hypothetical protein